MGQHVDPSVGRRPGPARVLLSGQPTLKHAETNDCNAFQVDICTNGFGAGFDFAIPESHILEPERTTETTCRADAALAGRQVNLGPVSGEKGHWIRQGRGQLASNPNSIIAAGPGG